ncbi:MAG: Cys-tRNA(Pro) deacylase [Epulopiscium sp.]|nr:Cys-tRNA(Pro) deacylase [Candidatus Epulonipiscium sp.]
MSQIKTNAMRILDTNKISYTIITYDQQDGKIDGISVAEKIGRDPQFVYKTLVAQGKDQTIFVFVIPVAKELDLKKASKVVGEKKVEMIPVKEIEKHTGYIRGGCSPVGMKKAYKTVIDSSAKKSDTIIVSGGKRGVQIELGVTDLQKITGAQVETITK